MTERRDPTIALVIPGEGGREAHPGSVPRLLVSFALVVVILEALAAAYLQRWPANPASAVMREHWAAIERPEREDLVVLGDSSGHHAFDTDLVSRELGIRARNYCCIGANLAFGDALMLERRLKSAPPPRAVLLIHTYDIWPRGITGRVLSDSPVSRADLAAARDAGVLPAKVDWGLDAYRWLPTWFRSVSLRRLLTGDAAWFESSVEMSPTGFRAMDEAGPDLARADLGHHLSGVRAREFRISAPNRWGVERMVAMAREHGFALWYAPAPFLDEAAEHEEFARCWQLIADELEEIGGGALRVLRVQPPLYPAAEMWSIEHVTRTAAERYTRTIVDAFPAIGW